jgi:hypothetical protein
MQMDPEIRCLIMMGRRAKAMAFYMVAFGFAVVLLKNPDELDGLTALLVIGLFGLISLYYLTLQACFTRHRFAYALAAIQDDTARHMIRRENAFRRVAYGVFILLAFLFVAYLGTYNG